MISCLKTGCKNFWNRFLVRAQKAGAEVIGVASNLETFPGVGRKGMCQHCIFCLLPNKLSTSAAEQLHEFDLMDDVI